MAYKYMTQEEKAKRYDEALERARKMYNSTYHAFEGPGGVCYNNADLETLFPELAGSEDEKVRKELIMFIKKRDRSGCDYDYDKWLSWLEKQGSEPDWCHHKVDLSDCSEEYRKAYYDGWNNCNMQHSQCKSESNVVVKCLINGMKFYYEDNKEATWGTEKFSMKVKDILSWLEKQGEFTENKDDADGDFTIYYPLKNGKGIYECIPYSFYGMLSSFSEDKDMIDFLHLCFYTEEECNEWIKQNNPADKVETKFKVGDWVVDKNGTVLQILSYNNGIYKHTNGYSSKMFEDEWRLWDITKDAKDGDILMANAPFIFNGNLEGGIGCPGAHCAINTLGKFQIPKYPTHWTGHTTTPATKEQRDLLFQKMKESGYEWDAEKKELKEISNALEECEIEHIEHGKYYYCIKDYYAGGNKRASKGDVVKALNGMNMMALGVEANEYFIPVKSIVDISGSAWSEEDEKTLNEIFSVAARASLRKNTLFEKSYDYIKWQNWLKSLRDRVQQQPKPDWSKADEEYFNFLEKLLESLQVESTENEIKKGTNSHSEYYYKVIQWLKSIKDKYTWKPSKGQLECLGYAIDKAEKDYSPLANNRIYLTLKTLKEELEKLKGE